MKENEQDVAVREYLEKIGVVYKDNFHPALIAPKEAADAWRNIGKTDWKDQVRVTFHPTLARRQSSVSFDYYQGLGHLDIVKNEWLKTNNEGWYWEALSKTLSTGIVHDVSDVDSFMPIRKRKYMGKYVGVHATAASVLYCLLSDMEAVYVSFADWCSDFGGNTDSITDKNAYESCRDNGFKLFRIFDTTEIERLRELLEDY